MKFHGWYHLKFVHINVFLLKLLICIFTVLLKKADRWKRNSFGEMRPDNPFLYIKKIKSNKVFG